MTHNRHAKFGRRLRVTFAIDLDANFDQVTDPTIHQALSFCIIGNGKYNTAIPMSTATGSTGFASISSVNRARDTGLWRA